jgi:hypothetical protein
MHGWENNIKMYLRKIGFEGVDWVHLSQDRDQWWALVDTVMNLGVCACVRARARV